MHVACFALRAAFSLMLVWSCLVARALVFLMHAFCLSMCRPCVRSLVLLLSACLPLSVCFYLFRCVVACVFDLVFCWSFSPGPLGDETAGGHNCA